MLNRYPIKEGFDWVDSEVAANIARSGDPLETAELWGTMKLQANGVRTTIMHALMHTQGLIARPWDIGTELGARATSNSLIVTIKASKNYNGKIIFDVPRHKHLMGFEKDWPRMNTLPEWFTVGLDRTYRITNVRTHKTQTRTGKQLHDGLELRLKAAERTTLLVEPIHNL